MLIVNPCPLFVIYLIIKDLKDQYGKKNLEYSKKQSEKFLLGESPPDFAPENYEIKYIDRVTLDDLTNLGKKQLSLESW